jgi:MtN3 and saliva related transmembrane protein
MDLVIIGSIGGTLIVCSYIPQLLKILKNKSAKDVSLMTYSTLFVAQLLWTVYGIMIRDVHIILTNSVSLFLTICILIASVYYRESNYSISLHDNMYVDSEEV